MLSVTPWRSAFGWTGTRDGDTGAILLGVQIP
jgi:hypothetical protein